MEERIAAKRAMEVRSTASTLDLGGFLAVDGPQGVVGEEGLEDRLGEDGIDPLDDARGDDNPGNNSSLP